MQQFTTTLCMAFSHNRVNWTSTCLSTARPRLVHACTAVDAVRSSLLTSALSRNMPNNMLKSSTCCHVDLSAFNIYISWKNTYGSQYIRLGCNIAIHCKDCVHFQKREVLLFTDNRYITRRIDVTSTAHDSASTVVTARRRFRSRASCYVICAFTLARSRSSVSSAIALSTRRGRCRYIYWSTADRRSIRAHSVKSASPRKEICAHTSRCHFAHLRLESFVSVKCNTVQRRMLHLTQGFISIYFTLICRTKPADYIQWMCFAKNCENVTWNAAS